MTKENPFPGMNPFFEQRWTGVHAKLIGYVCDALHEQLPADLVARTEEAVVAAGASGWKQAFRPDVQVRRPASEEPPADWMLRETASSAEPVRIFIDDEVERWIEIRDRDGRLITVIELLSPGNKTGRAERERYEAKRRAFMEGRVNLVEIDLVRQGDSLFPWQIQEELRRTGACYAVCLFRAVRPFERELQAIRLRARVPAVRIPLRPSDEEPLLELQPLIDQCHERGRYHFLDYSRELEPPLAPGDGEWAEQLLRAAGLK